jgi:membrane-anchored glycerophosphoryl diester phosphodiesterase (GDPDase)
MFKNLFDFSYKRSKKEAFGFYIAYFVLGTVSVVLCSFLFALVMAGVAGVDITTRGLEIGVVLATVMCLVLSFLILSKKRLLNHFGLILLGLLSGLLSIFGGFILGLIPVAILTTR